MTAPSAKRALTLSGLAIVRNLFIGNEFTVRNIAYLSWPEANISFLISVMSATEMLPACSIGTSVFFPFSGPMKSESLLTPLILSLILSLRASTSAAAASPTYFWNPSPASHSMHGR